MFFIGHLWPRAPIEEHDASRFAPGEIGQNTADIRIDQIGIAHSADSDGLKRTQGE